MAHLENYKASQVGKMLSHYGREADDGVKRSNENIRPEATALNYAVFSDGPRSAMRLSGTRAQGDKAGKFIKKKIAKTNANRKAKGTRKMDSRATVMSDWVFTLPKDWPEERDPYEFFQLCHWFVRDRYGDECSLPGFVHMDETTPHMHCPIVPMIDGEIRKRDVLTPTDFKRFHSDLQSYLDKELGFHVSVLLDEDQKVEKAKSKLTQDELDALNKSVKAEVDAQVASERSEMRSEASRLNAWEEDLARDDEAVKTASDELDEREEALDGREGGLDERQEELDMQEGLIKQIYRAVKALLKELKEGVDKQRLEEINDEKDALVEQVKSFSSSVVVDALEDDEDEYNEDEGTFDF